jgi:formylglycine-generating enzyme required for sulfatase activity
MRYKKDILKSIFISIILIVNIRCGELNNEKGESRTTPNTVNIGASTSYTLGSVSFKMIQATGDSVTNITFPMSISDDNIGVISAPFLMSETDVTYQLWCIVYNWGITNGYSFANTGQNGTDGNNSNKEFSTAISMQYPVTSISWRDEIVWCNALTEYYNENNGSEPDLAVVYCSDSGYTTPIRTSTSSSIVDTTPGKQDAPYVNPAAKGFRLPTSMEYEYAARYIGTTAPSNTNVVQTNGIYYTTGLSASGATATCKDNVITSLFGVFNRNYTDLSTYTSVTGTAVVKSKRANALGLYDMNGNVWKFNFDWYPGKEGFFRLERSGCFDDSADFLRISIVYNNYISPYFASKYTGLRLSRTK